MSTRRKEGEGLITPPTKWPSKRPPLAESPPPWSDEDVAALAEWDRVHKQLLRDLIEPKVAESRRAQGLPQHVEDPGTLDKIAALIVQAEEESARWVTKHPNCAACGAPATSAPYFWGRNKTPKGRRSSASSNEVRRSLCDRCHGVLLGHQPGSHPELPEWME
jgi:hypothetical protein